MYTVFYELGAYEASGRRHESYERILVRYELEASSRNIGFVA